jgi:hypothetical protein
MGIDNDDMPVLAVSFLLLILVLIILGNIIVDPTSIDFKEILEKIEKVIKAIT